MKIELTLYNDSIPPWIFHKPAPLSGPQDAGHAADATGRRDVSCQGLAPN